MSELLISSFLVSNVSESLRLLTKNERCEQIAQVAHQKWVNMSNSITSLRGNEWSWANRSEEMSDREQIAQIAHQKWAIRSENIWANPQPCILPVKQTQTKWQRVL